MLCRARILSKKIGNFKWTMMTQLVFDAEFYEYLEATKNEKNYQRIISRLIFVLKGAVTKFVLYLPDYHEVDIENINSWIIYLSKRGIKEFTFRDVGSDMPELTTYLFSCLELTHLELGNCLLHPSSEFGGFPNLLSLDVFDVSFENSNRQELLSRSPLLEILKLNMTVITSSSIFQVAGSLPKLQELSLDFYDCKISADAENRVLTSLPRLKTLDLYDIDFRSSAVTSCVIELICGFPNLESLSIRSIYKYAVRVPAVCSSPVDFSRMGQLQLLKVKLAEIRGVSKFAQKDVISTMPEEVITNILHCLPLQDAVQTRQENEKNVSKKYKQAHLFILKVPATKFVLNLPDTMKICLLHPSSEFGGFPNLLSLDVFDVSFENSNRQELLSRSPLLEILKLSTDDTEKVKQIEIAKLVNLKILSLSLCDIEDMTVITSSSIFQLAGSLPKLQELSLDFYDCKVSLR
ncbi:F-box/FBD/LRR-repeat protein-like protein [Tanacetum coccineum]